MNKENDKYYFKPGDIVTLKHKIANRPEMVVLEIVVSKVLEVQYQPITWTTYNGDTGTITPDTNYMHAKNMFKIDNTNGYYDGDSTGITTSTCSTSQPHSILKGIRCGWFTRNQRWIENIFSTKDIKLLEEDD